jgi:hypothetical protein
METLEAIYSRRGVRAFTEELIPEKLLLAAVPMEQAGVCCINMDYGTLDDNIFAMFEVVERYRRYGAWASRSLVPLLC